MAEREHKWDWVINGKGYLVLRENGSGYLTIGEGTPVYRSDAIPAIANEAPKIAEEERKYPSLHGGFGFARYLIPATYDFGDCIDTTQPRRIKMPPLITSATAPAAVTGGFVELGSNFFVAAGRYLCKVNTSTDLVITPDNSDYTKGFDAGASTVISSAIAWDSLIDVWFSSATDGRTYSGSAAPTTLSGSNVQRVYSAKFWSESANAFVQVGSTTVSGDPAVTWIAQGAALDSAIGGNWVTQYDIGDDTRAITGVAGSKTMAWVAKTDGLYYVDGRSGKSMRVFEAYPIDGDNGEGIFADSMGRVWYPSKGGLLRYTPQTAMVEDVTPGRGLSHSETIYGRVRAVTQYKGWYYASIYNGTTSYIMVGRDREGEPGIGPVIWHGALAKLTGEITHLYVLGLTSPPRLYFAAGTTVGYIRIDAAYTYATTGKLYFPADNFESLGSRWNLAGFVFSCKGFNASTYADVYAKIDKGDWQLVNRLQASGRVFLPIPSGDWRFTEIAFYLDLVNADTSTTPEIWGITMLATQRVYTRQLVQTSVVCSKRVLDHYGIRTRRSGPTMVNELDSLSVERPITADDYLTGEKRTRRFLVQPIHTRLARFGEKGKWEEWAEAVDLTMVAQASATVQVDAAPTSGGGGSSGGGSGFKWDTGAKYNSGVRWA